MSFKNYLCKQNTLGIWKNIFIYNHLKIEWWETKTKPKISIPTPPPFSKIQLHSFTPNPLPYLFPRKHRRIGNKGLQSVHNSSSLLLLPPHTLLFQSEVTHTSRPSGNKAPDPTWDPPWPCGYMFSYGLKGIKCFSMDCSISSFISFSDLGVHRSIPQTFFLILHCLCSTFCSFLNMFSTRCHNLADGFSCVLWWACWSHLCSGRMWWASQWLHLEGNKFWALK